MTSASGIEKHRRSRVNTLATIEKQKSSDNCSFRKRENRRVHFKTMVSVRPILHVDDMSEERIHAIWLNEKDMEDIRNSLSETLKLMSVREPKIDNESHFYRGLEIRTRKGERERAMNKSNALNAVLDEQDRQRSMGIHNEKLLGQIYTTECRVAKSHAYRLGITDELLAKRIQDESSCIWSEVLDFSNRSQSSDEAMDYCEAYRPQLDEYT
jgi:hypothetical protein